MTNLENVPDFISNPIRPEQNVGSQRGFISTTENVPDFIQPNRSINFDDIEQPNRLNTEVSQELGIDLDKEWSSDLNAVKTYVDSLSDEDYKTWTNLKKEGYSLEARKALMDNQDLLRDINNKGANKYLSNKPTLLGSLTEIAQAYNLGYEQVLHPRTEDIQGYLDKGNLRLEENLGKENMMNRWIEKQNPYGKMSPNLAEGTINNYETFVNIAQIPKVLGQMILSIGSSGVNTLDEYFNRIGIHSANLMNLLNQKAGTKKGVNVNYGEDRSNLIGSYLQTVADVLDIHLTTTYPIVTYIFGLLGANQTDRDSIGEIIDKGPEAIADYLLSLDVVETFMDKNLNEQDQLAAKQAIKYGIYEAIARLLKWGGKKISSSDAVQNFKMVSEKVDSYGKRNAALETKKYYEMREAAGKEPVGTEILEGERPIAKSTEQGGEFTREGALDTLVAGVKGYGKGVKEYLSSYFRNRNRQLLQRDPNAPVGELPEIGGKPVPDEVVKPTEDTTAEEKPTEEIKPKEEVKIEDLEESPKPNLRKAAPKAEISKGETSGAGIGGFIKKIANSIAGTEGGLSQELITKLQNSTELQNEYVNTIDPYLRSNGAENPAGVIKDQLADFVQTAKNQLETRRNNNMEFRKGQMKYRTEIPDYEKVQRKSEDLELKDLIKILSKSQDNPEQFLKFLLNLPKEKVQNLEKYIPDFSKNLGIIQDTLEITKAITKPDLIDKFLSFKSEWRLRNKGFLKKLFYSYLKEKYREQGLRANMKELENLINQLSEEELKQRAESMQAEDGEFPVGVNNSLRKIIYSGSPRAGKPHKKVLEMGHGDMIPKGDIYDELVYEGYRDGEFTNDEYLADKNKGDLNDILNTKYANGTTPKDWIDFYNIGLKAAEPGLIPFGTSAQSLSNGVIQFRNNLDRFNAWVLGHEIWHQVKGRLTTKELFDFYNGMVKSTKSLRKYEGDLNGDGDMKEISEYMSLDRTRAGIEEYVADSFAQVLYKGDLRELSDFLSPTIFSLDLSEKVQNIFSQIAKDLRDNLSAFETENGKYSTQVEEIKKMIEKVKPSEENKYMTERRYEEWQPMMKNIAGRFILNSNKNRLIFLRSVEPKLSNMKYDLDVNSERLGSLIFEMEDGRKLTWDEFKNTLSKEQLNKLESEDSVLGDKERKENLKKSEQTIQNSIANISPKFSKYSEALNKIDPDIIGLVEKDGHIYVKYLIESQRERYELPDRPGYVEVKEVPVKDYFTEEELKQLPKDLQKIIKKDAD